ncbi:MAG: hypothetical protein ACOX5Z_00100 [Desulfobulbus sp.]|jgi:hypothetical protein
MKQNELLNIGQLGNGAAEELFAQSLERVVENVLDPNTRADAVRTITLKVKVKPGKKDRTLCQVELTCEERLAPAVPFETALFVGMQNGKAAATEYRPEQGKLFTEEKKGPAAITKIAAAQ